MAPSSTPHVARLDIKRRITHFFPPVAQQPNSGLEVSGSHTIKKIKNKKKTHTRTHTHTNAHTAASYQPGAQAHTY